MDERKNFVELTRDIMGQRKRFPSDVEGSYTGTYNDPEDPYPVQDADDL
ncbi:MAG: hypothetical protein IKU32_06050 [Clostridia bacterium]|nr:hypothetical protein [Clostridia bacterium]